MGFLLALICIGVNKTPYYTSNMFTGDLVGFVLRDVCGE
jgi:hypothetical protein